MTGHTVAVDPTANKGGRRAGIATAAGVVMAGVAIACFVAGNVTTLILATVVLTAATAEAFSVFRRAGYKPATLVALLAVPAAVVGGYLRGTNAIALVMVVAVVLVFCWYLLGVIKDDPVSNAGVTLLGIMWVGLLGSFAGLVLAPSAFHGGHGIGIFVAAALVTVGYDVGGYAFGSLLGKHRLAPSISPGKTWEGLIGGIVVGIALAIGVVRLIDPWSLTSAIALGIVVSVVAPIGDLCESLVKRSLGVKDMSSLLPEHGGVLDRIDGLLFALPAVYELARLIHLH